MNIEKISMLIKTKRKEKNLTQEELASRINVTEKAVSRWETGRGTPDISLLEPLSKELGISISELLNGKEDKKGDKNIKEIINYIDVSKKKNNKKIIFVSSLIYAILLFLYLLYLKVDYSIALQTYEYEIKCNLFFMISVFLNNRLISNYYYDKIEDRERMNRISYIMILVLYLIMFLNLTIFGRGVDIYYVQSGVNLIPFRTLTQYIANPEMYNILINVIGNIVILMPLQFLIIKIFDLKKFKTVLFIDIALSFTVEAIQLITHLGVFDVDDIILNVFGMLIIYFIMSKKYNILGKYKGIFITSFISLVIVFILFDISSWYHFGDIPSMVILLRLIVGFLFTELIVYFIYCLIRKNK